MKCKVCGKVAAVALKSCNAGFCAECYLRFFRRQVERGIATCKLFGPEDKILVAISGGKDSLSLLLELCELGYQAHGLFIDLAIPGSSEIARERVVAFCSKQGLTLHVADLARDGLAIPLVKKHLRRPVCSACGQIKRYYFNKIALEKGYDVLATGHNLDDETGRLFSNVLRWDEAYLSTQGPLLEARPGFCRKVKPLWRLTEFEIGNYAFLRGIEHHWHGCPYSAGASFTTLKSLLGRLERAMPGRKLDFYQGFLERGKPAFSGQSSEIIAGRCPECGAYAPAGRLCGVCGIKKIIQEAICAS